MRARKALICLAALTALTASGAWAQDSEGAGEGAYADRGELLNLPVSVDALVICHGFNCLYRDEVGLSAQEHGEIARLMKQGLATPAAERAAIARVMAWLDKRIGPQIGTAGHVAQAGAGYSGDRGQFDCVDTTHNSTGILRQLYAMKLMTHHHVVEPASRAPPFHNTAVIAENRSGAAWAVDSWTRGYGEAPDVVPLQVWLVGAQPADLPHPASH